VNREHDQGDEAQRAGKVGPIPSTDDQADASDSVEAIEPVESIGEGTTDGVGSDARSTASGHESTVQAAAQSTDANSSPPTKDSRRPWKQWGRKFWAGVAVVVTGAVGAWLGVWLAFFAGPPATVAPPTTSIGNPGHPPGRQDVSTMSLHHRFYAVPNFYEFQRCGRPCWLPLYQLPTETSAALTHGWPCEYYEPDSTPNGPFCLQPPPGRAPGEIADPAVRNSGDQILVVCQVKQIGNGQAAQTIRNEAGQSSNIWDMVAVPKSHLYRNSVIVGRLHLVPGMPGFYEAYGSDIWLGNTGWHSIPC
jgi:hypothetical protein